jgi:hypothetical protein
VTVEEATTYVGWIQKAFPHMTMEPKLYVRALVHYDAEVSKRAILDAITNDWTYMPKVAEVVGAIKRREATPKPHGCHHGISFFDRCPFCVAEADAADGLRDAPKEAV